MWNGVPYQAIWFVQRQHRSVADHEAITTAPEAREADMAGQGMLNHIGRARAETVERLQAIGSPESEGRSPVGPQ